MTIKEYLKENPDFDFIEWDSLPFSEPDNKEEAYENLKYVISETKDLDEDTIIQAIMIVFRSYYNGTIV